MEEPGEIRPALESALRANKPSIVEVTVDAYEPPMPSKVTLKQAAILHKLWSEANPKGAGLR